MMQKNTAQEEAIQAVYGQVLLVSCPGSGKTTTMLRRIRNMISQGIAPSSILMVTFTEAAAKEMKKRFADTYGDAPVTFCTIHALCIRIMYAAGMNGFHIMDASETDTALRSAAAAVQKYFEDFKNIKNDIGLFKNTGILKGRSELTLTEMEFKAFVKAYENTKDASGCIDFDDLLIHGKRLLTERPGILSMFREKFRFIICDEYQDTNPIQKEILYLLAGENGNLCVVGDDDQSIYGFRGAVPEHLQSLINAGALTVYELRSNYRSSPAIVAAANDLIRHNTSHRVLEMQAMRETEGILHCLAKLGEADSAVLANMIAKWRGPTPPVVLCRNNRMLDKLSEELTARDVSHKRIGKRTSALHSPLFVKAHAVLKCFVNPHDETAFLLAHEGLGVDAAEYAQLRVAAVERGKSGFEVFRENLPVERLETMPSEDDATANALEWFASGGYLFDPADGDSQSFLDWLGDYISEHPLDTIADYLDWLALVDVQDEMPGRDEEPAILLMTCHASKGLEFPCVIIAGCNESVLPGKQAVAAEKKGDTAAIEDERRLMYVAVTRARDTLILAVRPEDDERSSRFLAELGM